MSLVRTIIPSSRRQLLVLALVAAAVLLAVGLVLDPAGRSDRTMGGNTADTTTLVEPAAPDASGAGEGSIGRSPITTRPADAPAPAADAGIDAEELSLREEVAVSPAQPSSLDAPSLDARIVRTSTLRLRLARGTFEERWGDAQSVATSFDGYIATASRSGSGDRARLGTITMRVPTARFDAAVDRLRELDRSRVEQLDVASQDVTQEFVDVESRLRHDRRVEGRLLALLAETKGVSEVLAVQARLDQVQEQIEVSRGRLQYLGKVTAMSTIQLTLREPAASSAGDDSRDASVLGEAWQEAGERLAGNVAAAIVWLGGALPALVVLAVVGIVARLAWRRHDAASAARRTPSTD